VTRDPVCGTKLDSGDTGPTTPSKGRTIRFWWERRKADFSKDPDRYLDGA
jgi:YHS domain-containing protein